MSVEHLVTGGAGFIGSHVSLSLLDRGDAVVCIDNLNSYYDVTLKRMNLDLLRQYDDFTMVEGDIRDPGLLSTVFSEHAPVNIIHEAAQAGVRYSVERPLDVMGVNVTGTLNLLEAARKHDVERFVNASSSSVYGVVGSLPFSEDHPTNPISPYGVSKLAAEHYVRVYGEIYGLSGVSLRYFTVFGPRMRPDLAISIFTRAALVDAPIEIFGTGEKTRDFTYITNVVDATLRALDRGRGEYNIGCGERITIGELARRIIDLTDSSSEIVHSEDAEGDMQHTLSSIDRARDDLGYEVEIDLDRGLSRFVEWFMTASR